MTDVVIATRSGIVTAPDGTKHRLVRGKTLADARHPLAVAYPELFAPHTVDLAVDDELELGESATGRDDVPTWKDKVAEVEQTAEGYREQLAAIVEGLHDRNLVPADTDMTRPGWLAELLFTILDGPAGEPEPEGKHPEAPVGDLPKPRKRAARPRPAAVADAEK